MTLILSNDDVSRLITMPETLAVLEDAYGELHHGRAVTRRRSDSLTPTAARDDAIYGFKTMDGVVPSQGVSAVRLNSDIVTWPTIDGNQRRVKVPAAPNKRWVGLILLFSTDTGEPLAILPDGVVQRYRVGATNGLGVKYMAREDAATVAILGSGWQAGTQLMAACAVRDIKEIRCYSPNPAHRVAFAQEMTDTLSVEITPTGSAAAAIAQADIVMCATNSIEAVFFADWLEPGMHVSAIKTPEIEPAALKRAARIGLHYGQHSPLTEVAKGVVLPDQTQGRGWSANEAVDFSTSPLLPQMVVGEISGREDDGEITCFINDLGLGLQFAAVAGLVHRKAVAAGIGQQLPTDWFTEDVHP
jgi:ornithine cyclodeaminase/alanine dehydrogenase-like protein (mu-crystallin family)